MGLTNHTKLALSLLEAGATRDEYALAMGGLRTAPFGRDRCVTVLWSWHPRLWDVGIRGDVNYPGPAAQDRLAWRIAVRITRLAIRHPDEYWSFYELFPIACRLVFARRDRLAEPIGDRLSRRLRAAGRDPTDYCWSYSPEGRVIRRRIGAK